MSEKERIVQLIPAEGWYAFKERAPYDERYTRVIAFGLTNTGNIWPVFLHDVDYDGSEGNLQLGRNH